MVLDRGDALLFCHLPILSFRTKDVPENCLKWFHDEQTVIYILQEFTTETGTKKRKRESKTQKKTSYRPRKEIIEMKIVCAKVYEKCM